MAPRPYRVTRSRQDTRDTLTLELEPVEGPPLTYKAGPGAVATDRDRHLADAEDVQHRELPGLVRQRRALDRLELEGEGVPGVLTAPGDPVRPGRHRVSRGVRCAGGERVKGDAHAGLPVGSRVSAPARGGSGVPRRAA